MCHVVPSFFLSAESSLCELLYTLKPKSLPVFAAPRFTSLLSTGRHPCRAGQDAREAHGASAPGLGTATGRVSLRFAAFRAFFPTAALCVTPCRAAVVRGVVARSADSRRGPCSLAAAGGAVPGAAGVNKPRVTANDITVSSQVRVPGPLPGPNRTPPLPPCPCPWPAALARRIRAAATTLK